MLERRPQQEVDGSRAGGLHTRTIEIFDQRGGRPIASSPRAEHEVALFAVRRPRDQRPSQSPHQPTLSASAQKHIERIMAEWLGELGVSIHYGQEVTGFEQDDDGVDVGLAPAAGSAPDYLVGCDGGRSPVRKAVGIDFPGWEASRSVLIAEVEMSEAAGVRGAPRRPWHQRHRPDRRGPADPGRRHRARADDCRASPAWTSSATSSSPSPDRLRRPFPDLDLPLHRRDPAGRFLPRGPGPARRRLRPRPLPGRRPGHSSTASTTPSTSAGSWPRSSLGRPPTPSWTPTRLSATRPRPARCGKRWQRPRSISATRAQRRCARSSPSWRKWKSRASSIAAERLGLDIRYDLGDGHPLLGRRMPDLDLARSGRPAARLPLLHHARPLLLNLGEPGDIEIAPRADRVRLVDAECSPRVGAADPRRGPGAARRCWSVPTARRLGGRGVRKGAERCPPYLVRRGCLGVGASPCRSPGETNCAMRRSRSLSPQASAICGASSGVLAGSRMTTLRPRRRRRRAGHPAQPESAASISASWASIPAEIPSQIWCTPGSAIR